MMMKPRHYKGWTIQGTREGNRGYVAYVRREDDGETDGLSIRVGLPSHLGGLWGGRFRSGVEAVKTVKERIDRNEGGFVWQRLRKQAEAMRWLKGKPLEARRP